MCNCCICSCLHKKFFGPESPFCSDCKHGSISIDELGGWVRKDNKKRAANIKEDYYYNSPNPYNGKQVYQAPDLDNMFNKLAAELHELGANGIINLKITQTVEFQKEIKQFIHRVTISGMAISK